MQIGLVSTLTLALLLASCGRAPETSQPESRNSTDALTVSDVSEPPAPGRVAPGVSVTAASGVAFNYAYAFRLPPARIAAAQEAHAQACEKLGIARCRITGMRYKLVGENDIQAMLVFKLDPAIARGFGKNAINVVQATEGTLVDAEITGTDAGAAIAQLSTDRDRATDELRRIDTQLARRDIPASERAELQRQRGEIAATIAAASGNVSEQRASLATTPMTFDYTSGPAVAGFDPSAPLTSATNTFLSSAQTTLAFVLGFLAIFGPPAIALGLLYLLYRRLRPWLPRRTLKDTPA